MSTGPGSSTSATPSCAEFEAQLPEWLEGALDDGTRLLMERHRGECVACRSMVNDLDAVVRSAGALPLLTPSRDLWPEIESRLEAPVIPLGRRVAAAVSASHGESVGGMSVRRFAVAAALLVAATSAVTWRVARAPSLQPGLGSAAVASGTVATTPPVAQSGGSTPVAPDSASTTGVQTSPALVPAPVTVANGAEAVSRRPGSSRSASEPAFVSVSRTQALAAVRAGSAGEVDVIYEREIAALRQIVDQRFSELDPVTVDELQRNLAIIDQAIADSRKALQSDPRSGLLAGQLDRTLEAKLALMRRVALL